MKYKVTKEGSDFVVIDKKSGLIIAYFEKKFDADQYLTEQERDNERANVMSAYNTEQEGKALISEFLKEFC